jgi:hypothetical protein
MPEPVLLIVSIDTEEDNWYRSRQGVTVANVGELRRAARVLGRWGARPTYFTTYHVARDPRAVDVLREISDEGRAEIGAHLHPWNTPPLTETFVARHSMLQNLPADLQLAKLRRLTATLEEAFDGMPSPRAFRAGRYGLGRETVGALLATGYRVDSSVMPYLSLEADDGPTFVGAPLDAYRLAPGGDVRIPVEDGDLIELPMSCGFSRGPFGVWDRVHRFLQRQPLRPLRLVGLASRAGVVRRIILSPELAPVGDLVTLSRRLLEQGVRHLHLQWHSPTLMPGLSPFARTAADVDRVYATIDRYFERLSRLTTLKFTTVSEAAARLAPALELAPC